MPLRLRVILLVTVFNVAVFGGGLVWLTRRLSTEHEKAQDLSEDLVFERLRGLLDSQGERVAGQVIRWEEWARYEDALVVQLREFEPGSGLVPDIRRVAEKGVPAVVPRGVVVPLRRPPFPSFELPPPGWDGLGTYGLPRGMVPPIPFSIPALAKHLRTPVFPARLTSLAEVWGACLLPRPRLPDTWPRAPSAHPLTPHWSDLLYLAFGVTPDTRRWPWKVPLAFQRAIYWGLSPQRQRIYDARMNQYLAQVLRDSRSGERAFEGGPILPLRDSSGATWGAVYVRTELWPTLFFAPWRWRVGAEWVGLPKYGFPPVLDVSGLFLNPMGSSHRPPIWDQDQILSDIRLAATERKNIENERGLSVPLRLASGDLWGGVWLKPRRDDVAISLLRQLAPWFLVTTVLLTMATLIGMRRLVLDPVRRLARGAKRLSSGDLAARVPAPSRNDELSDLVRTFNAMASEVEGFNARLGHEVDVATAAVREAEAAVMTQRRLAATGELAAGIAHEINNPLGGMLNALEVLQRADVQPGKRDQYHQLLQGGLERIRQTVGQVLRLAPRETRVEPVIMANPLGDALGLVRHRAAQQETLLILEGTGGRREFGEPESLDPWRALPTVRGQQNELGQAVLNLLVNSLDALESGGTVTLGMERAGGVLHLWVADDGPGMDPELIARAADPFFTTKETGKGTGLGLAIVHNVVSGHRGQVRFSSPPEGGFRVDVELPLDSGSDTGDGS